MIELAGVGAAAILSPVHRWLALFVGLFPIVAAAQPTNAPPAPRFAAAAAMTHAFAAGDAFTAKAELRLLDAVRKELVAAPIVYAFRDGKVRIELDLALAKSAKSNPRDLGEMRMLGLAKTVTLMDPVRKSLTLVYPDLRGFLAGPLPKDEAAAIAGAFQTELLPLGSEKIGGTDCDKSKLILKRGGTNTIELIIWRAPNQRVPAQIEAKEGPNFSQLRFIEVSASAPAAAFFEPAPGFTRHTNAASLLKIAESRRPKK